METFGQIMAPIRVLINAGIQQLSESLQIVLAPAAEYATQVLADIGPWMDWLKEKIVAGINIIIGAWTMFEVVLNNLGSVWEVATSVAELAMLTISESVKHAFTVVIPGYFAWWKDNIVNIFRDAFSLVYTIVTNHISKIVDAMRAVWDFIASGGQTDIFDTLGKISARSYTEGFKSSLTSLPEIAARTITQREKDLADKIGAVGGRLGQEFSDKMAERMVGVGSGLSEELQAATKNISLQGRPAVITQGNAATEGRLLTRGPGTRIPDLLQQMNRTLEQIRDKIQPSKRMVPNI
jgi:phage-related protein